VIIGPSSRWGLGREVDHSSIRVLELEATVLNSLVPSPCGDPWARRWDAVVRVFAGPPCATGGPNSNRQTRSAVKVTPRTNISQEAPLLSRIRRSDPGCRVRTSSRKPTHGSVSPAMRSRRTRIVERAATSPADPPEGQVHRQHSTSKLAILALPSGGPQELQRPTTHQVTPRALPPPPRSLAAR
jgi:hypothetical protein